MSSRTAVLVAPAQQFWRDCLSLLECMTAGQLRTADALEAMDKALKYTQLVGRQTQQLPLSTMHELVDCKVTHLLEAWLTTSTECHCGVVIPGSSLGGCPSGPSVAFKRFWHDSWYSSYHVRITP